jgi:aspartyl-tRNA(Asn)/glutamyl-tRNA(Gln) amidotransferase subunit A
MEHQPRESIVATVAAVRAGQQSAEVLATEYLNHIEQQDGELHAFLSVDRDGALAAGRDIDRRVASGETVGPLAGVPISIKDVLCTANWPTTAGSRALEGWRPSYDATAVARLRAAGAIILGKTNCDEFAMGSSTEHSAYGVTKNPVDASRVPGGSSGGSAAAVAAGFSLASIGTDTGGSVRQPAAFCGVVGLKPTYGRVSRYGLIAMASSLDTVGFFTTSVADAAVLLEVTAGHDPADATSEARPVPTVSQATELCDLSHTTIGVPTDCLGDGVDPVVRDAFTMRLRQVEAAGAKIIELPLPSFAYALAVYYILMPAEVSANMARFDGVRYGVKHAGGVKSFADMIAAWRSEHLGSEVQRRILMGAYVLSSGYQDAFYRRAQAARVGIRNELSAAFKQVTAIATPTAPIQPFKLGEKLDDPLAMYLADLYTVPANIAGVPAISLPLSGTKLPVGFQLMGSWWNEAKLLSLARTIEHI